MFVSWLIMIFVHLYEEMNKETVVTKLYEEP